jgi:hypothetical protein
VRASAGGWSSPEAVTVETPEGLRIAYSPLDGPSVSAGSEVAEGSPLGRLAAAGDGSTALTHLHLSVRRGETALDPETFLRNGAPSVVAPVVPRRPTSAEAAPQPAATTPFGAGAPAEAAVTPVPESASEPVSRLAFTPARMDSRAVHALPGSPSARMPRVALDPGRLAAALSGLSGQLAFGIVSAGALWFVAIRRAAPSPARSRITRR